MRVAFVCVDPGVPVFGTKGASVHAQEIIRAFRTRGDEVTVFCTRRGDDVPADLSDVRVVHLPVSAKEPAAREREVAGVADALAAAIIDDTEDPHGAFDLVYERFSLFSRVAERVAARTGARTVVELNAPLIDEQQTHRVLVDEAGARGAARSILASADVVACVSEPVATWAQQHGAVRTVVAPNGVNTTRIRPRAEADAAAAAETTPVPFRVGFVGTLKPWHGVEVLIEAIAQVCRVEHTDALELVIIGDGPERDALQVQAAGLPVRFTGAVRPSDIPELLSDLHVGVAPYPADADTYFSPLKVYEYLAAGLPVIASAVGQLPAILDNGRTGILVPPGDAAALADALTSLRDSPLARARMARAARAEAVERHDWSRVLDRILASVPTAQEVSA